ncbi:MAG TPA: DMT family transporter, partial [Candidatus Melainabacteria bacterium]|nr:DMT family transporter [Candidatus Melainabacteria bacterium]
LVYFICLQAAYKVGDYSLVYPVARGTGPLLATLGAVYFLHETPSFLAILGIALIILGVFIISGGARLFSGQTPKKPLVFGLLTGICIAAYTLWDKYAVADVGVPPMLLDYMATGAISFLLLPYVLKNREKLKQEWRDNRRNVIGVSLLSPLSYLIVLYVLISSPVYYVAPLREMSILIAAYLGTRLLKEGEMTRRYIAAGIMFGGVIALAFG